MSEPFVFHFRRAKDGTPEQMYLADIQAECGLCGHPQLQRYYHATPVHPVTPRKLLALAQSAPLKTHYECPNCGTAVGPADARSASFTWTSPDDAGLVRAYMKDTESGEVVWQLVPGRRLDPQELPGWEPVEHPDHPVADELTDAWVFDHLHRPVNPKLEIVAVLDDWQQEPGGGAIAEIASGMWLVAGADRDALGDEVREESDAALEVVALDDAVPHGLATHREPSRMPGALRTWLPERHRSRTDQIALLVDPRRALECLHRAFDVANLTWEERDTTLAGITTPRGETYPRDLELLAVLRRAVYTGLTPGDAAVLTAEEIVGTLLRVW